MNSDDRDPLLEKLRALPVQQLNTQRAANNLRAAENVIAGKVRPGIRWPEFAIAVALSTAGIVYTVGSVNKIERIYVTNHVSESSVDR